MLELQVNGKNCPVMLHLNKSVSSSNVFFLIILRLDLIKQSYLGICVVFSLQISNCNKLHLYWVILFVGTCKRFLQRYFLVIKLPHHQKKRKNDECIDTKNSNQWKSYFLRWHQRSSYMLWWSWSLFCWQE